MNNFMHTYKVSNGIQLYDTAGFRCGLLTDNVEHLLNIFLKRNKQIHALQHSSREKCLKMERSAVQSLALTCD